MKSLCTGTASGFGNGQLTSAGGPDVYLVKLQPTGLASWTKRFGDADTQTGNGVAVDKSGNVALVGSFAGTIDLGGSVLVSAGAHDVFIAKLDPAGGHLWSKSFGDAAEQFARAVGSDSAGNTIVAGNFAGAVNFGGGPLVSAGKDDFFLLKLDPQGNHLWSKSFGDAGEQVVTGVAIDAADEIAIFASGEGTIDFGGGALVSAGGPMGGDDLFVAKFDSSGKHLWSRRFGDAQVQSSGGVAVATGGTMFMAGAFDGLLDFGGGSGPLMNVGGADIFLAKLVTP